MGTIRKLVEEAKKALVAGKADAALGPCQAILERYPKHVEATCLLAETRREMRQLREAADLFERVIAADPESLIGHWGLSTILEEQGKTEAALYELQIAWDLNPGHPALREEIVRLRAKVGWDAEEPGLSQSGLARVYWRGHQYRRAVMEARRVMNGSIERLDVAVLLCEGLWRIGRLADAAELAGEILNESPDCLKASLIRGYARLGAGTRAQDEARKLLARAVQLDPECRVASTLFVDQAVPPPLVVQEIDPAAEPPSLLPAPTAEPAGRGSLWAIAGAEAVEASEAVEVVPPSRSVLAASLEVANLDEAAWHAESSRVEVAPASAMVDRAEVVERRSFGDVAPVPFAEMAPRDSAPLPHGDVVPHEGDPMMRRIEDLAALAAAAHCQEPDEADVPVVAAEDAVEDEVAWGADEAEAHEATLVEDAGAPEPDDAVVAEEASGAAVPAWMNAPSEGKGGTAGLDPTLYEEWADLLAEEVDLDPDAAARLEAALAEATGATGAAGPWREIVLDGVSLTPPEAGAPKDSQEKSRRAADETPAEAEEAPAARRQSPVQARPKKAAEPVERSAEDELAEVRARVAEGDLDAVAEAYRGLLRTRADLATTVATEVRELVEANPTHAGLRRALGDAYMRCGRFQKAIEEYNRAVSLQPPAAVA